MFFHNDIVLKSSFFNIFLCFISSLLVAQDIQLSQFYEADSLLNPTLVGNTHMARAMVHSRV